MVTELLKRRNELSEERMALILYSRDECETPEDFKDPEEYLRPLRKERLRYLRILGTDRRSPRPQISFRTEPVSSTPTAHLTAENDVQSDEEEKDEKR